MKGLKFFWIDDASEVEVRVEVAELDEDEAAAIIEGITCLVERKVLAEKK